MSYSPVTPGEVETCAHCTAWAVRRREAGQPDATYAEIRFVHFILCRP